MERVLILLYIHVYADGPTLPLWAGRRCSDSGWFKLCSSRRTWLYNAKAWASHAQQPTCWVVCRSKPSLTGESEGQQSTSIQYCTSNRTELGEREGERGRRARERGRAAEREIEAREKKLQKKWRELSKEQEGRKERQRNREEVDGRRNIHEGTHKQRQTWDATTPRPCLCWDHEKQEKADLAGSVQLARIEKNKYVVSVWVELCVYDCAYDYLFVDGNSIV